MRDGQCSLFSSFSPWSVLSFLFFFFIFFKACPFICARWNTSKRLHFLYFKYFAPKTIAHFLFRWYTSAFAFLIFTFLSLFSCALFFRFGCFTPRVRLSCHIGRLLALFLCNAVPLSFLFQVCVINTMSPKLWLSLAVCLQENQWPALAASIHFLLLAKVSPILILSRPGHISGQYSHLFSDKVSRSGIAFLTVSTNVCIQRFIISKVTYSDNLDKQWKYLKIVFSWTDLFKQRSISW